MRSRWNGGQFENIAGNPLINQPEWKANLGASYVVSIEDYGFLTFGANISWRDDTPATVFPDDPYGWEPSCTMVNGRIRYETEDAHWAMELYGRNIFDKSRNYNLTGIGDYDLDTYIRPGEPFMMGLRVTYLY